MTQDHAPESIIVLRIPREEKGRYVAASRAAGLTLAAWIRATLTAAAQESPSATHARPARQDRQRRP